MRYLLPLVLLAGCPTSDSKGDTGDESDANSDTETDTRRDDDSDGYRPGDADGDGFGDPSNTVEACSPARGYVSNGTDCDDASSAVYPGAEKVTDGLDNDCDGEIDA